MGNSISWQKRTSNPTAMDIAAAEDKKESDKEPEISSTAVSTNKQIFIQQLRGRYKQLYDAVQPIPYIKEKLYCVDRVFVEGGIELFSASWVPLESRHDIFSSPGARSKRRIILGEPGFGKSTLTLQYAYDWYNKIQESPLKDVEILLILRLRQLTRVKSIYKAFKQFILPRGSSLTEMNIQSLIESSCSVVLILDGYDEYPDISSGERSDIMKIIMSQMFHQFEVILTTRYLPEQHVPGAKLLRLTGFDDTARNDYIRKAVAGDDEMAVDRIKRRLHENPVLEDLCQVPLIFVMFAHMSHDNEDFQTVNTVTGFFRYMIQCLHNHASNKTKDSNVQTYHTYVEDHRKIDKVAFECLSKKDQQLTWKTHDLRDRLGQELYDQYIRVGILVEEDELGGKKLYGNAESNQSHREVRFYHKLFCEWYAAHHLAICAKVLSLEKLTKLLRNMDMVDLQYCYRFACGIAPDAASHIINFVTQHNGGDNFAILCILEQGGKIDSILGNVSELCSQKIDFTHSQNKLLQRSTVQVLEIASRHKIPISSLRLRECFKNVNTTTWSVTLKSNICISVLTTLETLEILESEIVEEDIATLLKYSSMCVCLRKVWFLACLIPYSIKAETLSVVRLRNIQVWWNPSLGWAYYLDLNLGQWKHEQGGVLMTNEQYEKEAEKVRRLHQSSQRPFQKSFLDAI